MAILHSIGYNGNYKIMFGTHRHLLVHPKTMTLCASTVYHRNIRPIPMFTWDAISCSVQRPYLHYNIWIIPRRKEKKYHIACTSTIVSRAAFTYINGRCERTTQLNGRQNSYYAVTIAIMWCLNIGVTSLSLNISVACTQSCAE